MTQHKILRENFKAKLTEVFFWIIFLDNNKKELNNSEC